MKPRPRCVHCDVPYGRRQITSHQVRWPIGEEMPPYRGNGIVTKIGTAYRTTNRETVRSVTMLSTNPEIRAEQEAQIARAPEQSENVATIDVWDGQTYRGGYDPFCTLRCALDYAHKALKLIGPIRSQRSTRPAAPPPPAQP